MYSPCHDLTVSIRLVQYHGGIISSLHFTSFNRIHLLRSNRRQKSFERVIIDRTDQYPRIRTPRQPVHGSPMSHPRAATHASPSPNCKLFQLAVARARAIEILHLRMGFSRDSRRTGPKREIGVVGERVQSLTMVTEGPLFKCQSTTWRNSSWLGVCDASPGGFSTGWTTPVVWTR